MQEILAHAIPRQPEYLFGAKAVVIGRNQDQPTSLVKNQSNELCHLVTGNGSFVGSLALRHLLKDTEIQQAIEEQSTAHLRKVELDAQTVLKACCKQSR